MYKAVLFDLDGTLLDTSEGVRKSIEYTVQEMGLQSLTEEETQAFIGPPIYQSLKNRYCLSDEDSVKGTEVFRNAYKNVFLFDAVVYPNLFQILHNLKSRNILIGVATYKREDYTIKLLEHFNISKLCDCIVGSDYENKMTKTDIINKCISNLGITNTREVILIGDTKHDALGALECGIDFIGVTYGFGFKVKEDVAEYPNMGVINDLVELINLL